MNKKILFLALISSTFLFSGCIEMPEKKIGIEPIFVKDGDIKKEIPDFKKISDLENGTGKIISDTTSTGAKLENSSTGKIISEENKAQENSETSTGENSDNSGTGEKISEVNNLILKGENEIISKKTSTGEKLENSSTGEIISEENKVQENSKSSTGENL